jgi:UDP-N-acetylmuramate--alanine ligase
MNNIELSSLSDEELSSLNLDSKIFGVIGVCGIVGNLVARILMDRGFTVIGTDMSKKEDCRFKSSFDGYNIEIYYGSHPEEFFEKIDYIIPPPSLPKTAKVFDIIHEKNIPILNLGDIFKLFAPDKEVICITGTNGKTTSTTLLKHVAYYAGLKPTEHNLKGMQGNNEFIPSLQSRLNGDVAILETGTDGTPGGLNSIITLTKPSSGILTNITPDHLSDDSDLLDYAKVKGELVEGLKGKQLIVNSDDPTIMGLIKELSYVGDLITFGLDEKPAKLGYKPCWCGRKIEIEEIISGVGKYDCSCGIKYEKPDYIATNISLKDKQFTVSGPDGEYTIKMAIEGLHNVYNCLGVIVAAREFLGLSYDIIQEAISTFKGVPGRMEIMGFVDEKTIMVDYAHNPAGVETVLRELKKIYGDFTVVITVSSESGHKGDVEILNDALKYAKFIVPASYSSRKVADEFIEDNPNLTENIVLTDQIPEEFRKRTLGATKEEVYEGIKTGLNTDVNTIVAIGEAAIKFKSVINGFKR